jgi:hypothetical protein
MNVKNQEVWILLQAYQFGEWVKEPRTKNYGCEHECQCLKWNYIRLWYQTISDELLPHLASQRYNIWSPLLHQRFSIGHDDVPSAFIKYSLWIRLNVQSQSFGIASDHFPRDFTTKFLCVFLLLAILVTPSAYRSLLNISTVTLSSLCLCLPSGLLPWTFFQQGFVTISYVNAYSTPWPFSVRQRLPYLLEG